MSRINKAMCILSMIDNRVYRGDAFRSDLIQKVICGKIKKSSLYFISFEKLRDYFMQRDLKEWRDSKGISLEPDVIFINYESNPVYLYEL